MSLVHLTFKTIEHKKQHKIIKVYSPDFSESGTQDVLLGELWVNFSSKEFRFKTSKIVAHQFCPPEYFELYKGDAELIAKRCREENFCCTAWSQKIFIKAKLELGLLIDSGESLSNTPRTLEELLASRK
jgi:hypothetical protein